MSQNVRKRYQSGPRWHGARLNLAMIASFVDTQARSAIDIGCNEGLFTCALAELGIAATGYEQNDDYLRLALSLRQHFGSTAAFDKRLFTNADADTVQSDVVLFLSVHHQIADALSLDRANDLLSALCRNARRQVFFQPACIASKYGARQPPFADNDYAAIFEYFSSIAAAAGMPHAQILGFSINDLPPQEPLRPMILFSRDPAKLNEGVRAAEVISKAESAVAAAFTPTVTWKSRLRPFIPPALLALRH